MFTASSIPVVPHFSSCLRSATEEAHQASVQRGEVQPFPAQQVLVGDYALFLRQERGEVHAGLGLAFVDRIALMPHAPDFGGDGRQAQQDDLAVMVV